MIQSFEICCDCGQFFVFEENVYFLFVGAKFYICPVVRLVNSVVQILYLCFFREQVYVSLLLELFFQFPCSFFQFLKCILKLLLVHENLSYIAVELKLLLCVVTPYV